MNADYDYLQENVTYVVSVIPRKTGLNFPLVPSVRPKIYGVDIGSWGKSEIVQSLLFKGTQANHTAKLLVAMENRRVVVTGIGAVSPLGNDANSTWESMKAGRSGINLIESMDTSEYPVKIGGEVRDFDHTQYFSNPKDARRMDRYAHLSIAAAQMALTESGLAKSEIDRDRVGVMLGSGIGGLGTLEKNHTLLLNRSPSRVSPFTIPMMISNIASGVFSMEHGFGGPNMAIVTACATANHSIGEAWRMIKFGDAEAFIAGGSEAAILPMGLAGFGNMKALSTRNDDPSAASRPFDTGRDGFVMGEGCRSCGGRRTGAREKAWSNYPCRTHRVWPQRRCLSFDLSSP
jgi:hypothetical protein